MICHYKNGDALHVVVQEAQKNEAKVFACFFDTIHAYSQVDDNGEILAVCGFMINENREGECFALLGKNCGKKMLELIRFLQKEIPRMMKKHRLTKALMTVEKGFLAGERLAQILGFYVVGVLPQFFLNNDYQLYERKENGFTYRCGYGT